MAIKGNYTINCFIPSLLDSHTLEISVFTKVSSNHKNLCNLTFKTGSNLIKVSSAPLFLMFHPKAPQLYRHTGWRQNVMLPRQYKALNMSRYSLKIPWKWPSVALKKQNTETDTASHPPVNSQALCCRANKVARRQVLWSEINFTYSEKALYIFHPFN